MTSEENLKLLVFAGPNGSGKSSITEYYDRPFLYINADEITNIAKKPN